jgi:hypothetical protein
MFGERKILALGDTHGGALIKNSGLDYFLVSSDIDTLGYSIKFYIWGRCFLNVSVLKQENEELIDMQQVLSQNIWLTPFIKIGGDMCMTKICCENGVFL